VAAALVAYLMQYLVSPYVGDVARYVRADPRNIAMRAAIRDRGLKLLKDLHDRQSYQRIIFVAHSLGTVIAYDLISLLWAGREQALSMREDELVFRNLRAAEVAAHALAGATEVNIKDRRRVYREAQRELRRPCVPAPKSICRSRSPLAECGLPQTRCPQPRRRDSAAAVVGSASGWPAIARELGLDRKTVRKCIARGLEPPVYGSASQESV
jgi:hypothetical protein